MENKFKTKAIEAEELNDIYNFVQSKYTSVFSEWRIVGKSDKQRTSWQTGELLFDDCGEPIMEDEWGDVELTYDELSEENKVRADLLKKVMTTLEKMI